MYYREFGINEPLPSNPYVDWSWDWSWREIGLSECEMGCKIYQHSATLEKVVAHNSAYGCNK